MGSCSYIGVFDVDGTLYTRKPTASEIEAATFVRAYFSRPRHRFTVASAQTAEMLMSRASYEASARRGFKRPLPKIGGSPGRRRYVAPEGQRGRLPFTDADAIMSMGTGCFFRKRDGSYVENAGFRRRLGASWRKDVLEFLKLVNDETERYFADIESVSNYRSGVTDVYPLEYRVQFCFPDVETKNRVKNRILSTLLGLRQIEEVAPGTDIGTSLALLGNLRVVDESRPHEGHYQFYLMPRFASKEDMVDEMLSLMMRGQMIDRLLIAGDMPPDLRVGCFSGRAVEAAFLLVGGSPLSPFLNRASDQFGKEYAGEDMRWLTNNLSSTKRPGFEVFSRAGEPSRLVVNGDIAYPGTTAAETIAAFLKDPEVPKLF